MRHTYCLSGKCQKGTILLVLVIHRLKNLHLRDLTLLSSLIVGLLGEPFSFCSIFYLIYMHYARIGAEKCSFSRDILSSLLVVFFYKTFGFTLSHCKLFLCRTMDKPLVGGSNIQLSWCHLPYLLNFCFFRKVLVVNMSITTHHHTQIPPCIPISFQL